MEIDIQATGRAIHALAALRDSSGDVTTAARALGITEETLRRAISEAGPQFTQESADGTIQPTPMGLRFAERVDTFPYVNW